MSKSLNDLMRELEALKGDDGRRFLEMEEGVLEALPAFEEDGSVCMYEVGGVLLGKGALLRWVECHKIK
jgi:hypothetical protein